jgi:hypothetical protein
VNALPSASMQSEEFFAGAADAAGTLVTDDEGEKA